MVKERQSQSGYRNYYRAIELHWSIGRGNQIIVSPLEFESISGWHQKNVPLPVVLRAIDRFLERKSKNKNRRNFLLSHVEGDISKLHEEYNLLHAGGFNPEEGEHTGQGDPFVETKLKQLLKKFKKLNLPQANFIETELKDMIEPGRLSTLVSFEDIETMLEQLDQKLMVLITEMSSPELLQSLKNELLEFLDPEKDGEFFQKAYNDQLRHHFGIPLLTVLG